MVKQPDGAYQYLVDGQPQVFIGMGYDAIYRYLSDDERAASYRRDFQILRDAGVNTITGWDEALSQAQPLMLNCPLAQYPPSIHPVCARVPRV